MGNHLCISVETKEKLNSGRQSSKLRGVEKAKRRGWKKLFAKKQNSNNTLLFEEVISTTSSCEYYNEFVDTYSKLTTEARRRCYLESLEDSLSDEMEDVGDIDMNVSCRSLVEGAIAIIDRVLNKRVGEAVLEESSTDIKEDQEGVIKEEKTLLQSLSVLKYIKELPSSDKEADESVIQKSTLKIEGIESQPITRRIIEKASMDGVSYTEDRGGFSHQNVKGCNQVKCHISTGRMLDEPALSFVNASIG